MVTYRRAFFAVFVTALAAAEISRHFTRNQVQNLIQCHSKALDEQWRQGFASGRDAVLNDYWTIKRQYMYYATQN